MSETETLPNWREIAATGQLAGFSLLCLGVWLHAADSLLVATVMPAAVGEIGGILFVNWALALYTMGSILASALTGSITARIGLRSSLALAAMLYAAGCAVSALAPSMPVLLVGRLLQGLGGGAMVALVYVGLQELFPQRFWPLLWTVVSAIWGGSALCGPLIGGVFAAAGLWRWAFWAFAAQAGIVLAAASFLPDRRPSAVRGWSLAPLMLLALGTIGIASAGAFAGAGEGALRPALCGLGGLASLYGFARLDARAPRHLLPRMTLDLARPAGNGLLMILTLGAATTPFAAYGPLLLKLLRGTDPLTAGYLVAVEAVAWTLASFLTASVPAAFERRLILLGAALIATGAAIHALAVPIGSIPGILCGLVAQGSGFGLAWAYMVKWLVAAVPDAERSAAAGAASTMSQIGYAVGFAASGIAVNASGLAGSATPATAQQAASLLFAGFIPLSLIGLWFAYRLTWRRP